MIFRFNGLEQSLMNEKLIGVIDDFALKVTAEFSLLDLRRYVRKRGITISEDELYEYALSSDLIIEVDTFDQVFLPRSVFFKGAQFRITPLDAEIAGGYLMPGHRFMPFLSFAVFPGSVRLSLPDGSVAAVRRASLPREQVMMGLHFFGPAAALEYLIFDEEDNAQGLISSPDAEALLTVFDLGEFYASSRFRPGDSLMLTVQDWQKGEYSLERVTPSLDAVAAKKWVESMDYAMNTAIDEFGPDGDCNFQLALAMRNAEENPECVSLMSSPPLSFAAYFNLRKDLTVKAVDDRALFWDRDEEPDDEEDELLDALENLMEGELDAYFRDLGLSVSEGEVEAYMRDALFHGGGSAESVLGRVTAGRHVLFASAEDQEEFHDLWSVLWDEVRVEYDPAADPYAEIRSRFLAINDKALATMRELDARGTGLKIAANPTFLEFSRFTAMISSALVLFNQPGEEEGEGSPDSIANMIPLLDEAIDRLSDQLLESAPKNKPKVKAAKKNDRQEIYQLKISLKGSKPPIWRRILIPAEMELIDLHDAIQASMGWDGYHLHQFKQGNTFYLPEPDDEFTGFGGFDTEDSSGVRIDQLLRTEKDKIEYEYDFGDSWDHEVLLEKVLEPAAGAVYPVCVKGKGACPPEDCGGLWGYYFLLEILGDPEDEEHEGMLAWAGGPIDPAAFDLDEANARLREWFK